MTDDPMEARIILALKRAGIRFVQPQDEHAATGLDFYLPDHDLYIEVKQFHSDRIGRQMASAENVVVAQGAAAVEALARMIERGGLG